MNNTGVIVLVRDVKRIQDLKPESKTRGNQDKIKPGNELNNKKNVQKNQHGSIMNRNVQELKQML